MYNILFLLSTHIFDFYEAFASFFYCPLASIKCNCIVVICNCFVVDRLLCLFYNVYRDRSVHYAAERSDPVKKYNCLLALLVSVFLLLCACAQQQADQASFPDALSSAPSINVTPASRTPDSRPPATSKPATSKPATSAPATTAPATTPAPPPSTAPTQPAVWPDRWITIQTTDWITDREIIPFDDRFTADVPFGLYPTIWIAPDTDSAYSDYSIFDLRSCYIIMYNSLETEYVHRIPMDANIPPSCKSLAGDGYWSYWLSEEALYKIDLQSGAYTILDTKNETDIRWEVKACGKDTVCIFRLDAERNLRIYYRDLHSEAEKTLYEGVLPDVPTSENELFFYAPTTTQGDVYWEMINPAFYEIYLKYLNSPVDDLKDTPNLRSAIQRDCGIPMLVRYSCDFNTGALTADFGWYDTCWQSKDCKHDHFNYENTREEVPTLLNVAPVEIPNFSKLTGESPLEATDSVDAYMYSEFGFGLPYVSLDYPTWKLADIPVIDITSSAEYFYCITTEKNILQISCDGKNCNTIYTSENALRDLTCLGNYLYFVDGSTVICIDEAAGTWKPIVKFTADDFDLGWHYRHDGILKLVVRQGMYIEDYWYYPETGELKEESYI